MRPEFSSFTLAPDGPNPGNSIKARDLAQRAEIAGDDWIDARRAVHTQSSSLLIHSLSGLAKGNTLLIGHPALPVPDGTSLLPVAPAFGIAVCLQKGEWQSAASARTAIDCASSALPFQDEAFRTVALYHVIRDGAEREIDEACRVLSRGGELLVLGLNRNSWSANTTHRHGPLPRIHHGRLREGLARREMEIVTELGVGLMGLPKPRMERYHWAGLALPFADLLLLRIRHRSHAIPSRLKLEKFPAGVMPTSFIT